MKNVTLITGASEGFGKELAFRFAEDGHALLLVARRIDLLRQVREELNARGHQGNVFIMPADLSDPAGRRSVKEFCDRNRLRVDILVNNAGMGTGGFFPRIPAEKETAMIRINIEAVNEMIHLFLPDMIEKKRGIILNAASAAAFQPEPYMASYAAGKAFVLSLTEALAAEMRNTGVKICCFCPGPCATAFLEKAGTASLFDPKRNSGMKPPSVIIDRVYKELKKGKTVIIPEKKFAVLRFLQRFVPRPAVLRIMTKLNAVKS